MTKKMMILMRKMVKLVRNLNVNQKERKREIDLYLHYWPEWVEILK